MKPGKTRYTATLLLLLTISAYFLADISDTVIGNSLEAAPKSSSPGNKEVAGLQAQRELSEYVSILDRGLFGEGSAPSTARQGMSAATTYTLVGTVEGTVFSGAVLADSTGQYFYHVNEKLPDGSVIVSVTHDKATLRRNDGSIVDIENIDETKIVALQNVSASGVKKLSDGRFLLDQREVQASTENMGQILMQARALPYQENGKTVGFRINEIIPGSIYTKIGLQNGDIIQQVNSQSLDDPGKFFQLYQGFQHEKNIAIDIIRSGQRQTLSYEIR